MFERGDARLSYEELSAKYPDGSDDPKIADLLRKKRGEAVKPAEPEYYINPRGQVIGAKKGEKLTDEKLREICVGDTCDHYEHETDVSRGWYKEDEKEKGD